MFVVVSALKIHMSKNAHDALRAFPEVVTKCRNYFYDQVVNDYNLKSIFWPANEICLVVRCNILTRYCDDELNLLAIRVEVFVLISKS